MSFGTHIKELRLKSRISLRELSRKIGMDASNWSKIERNILPLPSDKGLLTKLSNLLELSEAETQHISDLAALSRGQLPADLQDEKLISKMPAFFRAIRGQEYTTQDMEQMVEEVRKLNSDNQ